MNNNIPKLIIFHLNVLIQLLINQLAIKLNYLMINFNLNDILIKLIIYLIYLN